MDDPLLRFDDAEQLATDWGQKIPGSMANFVSSQMWCRGIRASKDYILKITRGQKTPSAKLAGWLEYWTGISKELWTFGPAKELRRQLVLRYPPLQDWEFDPAPGTRPPTTKPKANK